MMIDSNLVERPDTFAFQTREGVVGLLQVEAGGKEERRLTIRYRLERQGRPPGSGTVKGR
jgi:hypothetical protein